MSYVSKIPTCNLSGKEKDDLCMHYDSLPPRHLWRDHIFHCQGSVTAETVGQNSSLVVGPTLGLFLTQCFLVGVTI